MYNEDRDLLVRKSHENPSVKTIYREFLGKPGKTWGRFSCLAPVRQENRPHVLLFKPVKQI
ncbi:MAG: iron hydrogenase small subunit [Clostridiales bacterium]|nr:iron hydrogenase small subunit [Clostridiales bacterium]